MRNQGASSVHEHLWQMYPPEADDSPSCDTVQPREPCTNVI